MNESDYGFCSSFKNKAQVYPHCLVFIIYQRKQETLSFRSRNVWFRVGVFYHKPKVVLSEGV